MAESLSHLQLEFDRLAKRYDEIFPRSSFTAIIKVLKRAKINRYANVLDVGCGTGRMTKLTAKNTGAKNIVGVDISRNMLRTAKHRIKAQSANYEFALAEASTLPFCDKSFDLVLHNQTIQFYKDLKSTFKESYRTLKKRGKVVFIVVSRNEAEKRSPLSFVSFTKKCLRKNLEENLSTSSTARRHAKFRRTLEVFGNIGKNSGVETYALDYFETFTIKRMIKILQVRPFLLECLPDDLYREICGKYVEYLRTTGLKRIRVKKKVTAICIKKE